MKLRTAKIFLIDSHNFKMLKISWKGYYNFETVKLFLLGFSNFKMMKIYKKSSFVEIYGCLFVAKFNDWLSCVQHIDLIHSKTDCLISKNNILLFSIHIYIQRFTFMLNG